MPAPQNWKPRTVVPRRILVVEDNVGAATILAKMLSTFWKHEVRMAHDGPAALEAAQVFRPEVILLDIGLPGMSGYEVARALRQRPEGKQALLVALTGYEEDEDRKRSALAGCDEHLVKPPELNVLESLFVHPKLSAAGG